MPNGRMGIIEEEEKRREPGIYSLAEMPPPPPTPGVVGVAQRAYETTIQPWVKGYQKYLGQPTVRAGEKVIGAAKEHIIDPISRDIGYIATGTRTAASDFAKEKATELVAGAQPIDQEMDPATRVRTGAPPVPQPVVAPRSSLESVWGITQETLPTGATKYTLPGTEGTMTAEPRADYLGRLAAAGTTEEEQKKSYLDRLGREGGERYQGVVAETTYREQVERAKRTQAETDARMEEQILQELAGLRPRTGIRELGAVERWGKKTPAEEKARAEALGETQKAYITGRATREAAGIQAEGVVSAAGMKAQTEAAKLGIQAADVKSRMQLRQAQMDDMLTKAGLLEPMKLKLQGVRDTVARTKIQRDTAEAASKDIYEKEVRALESQFGMGQIDLETYKANLNALTRGRVARQGLIIKTHPLEGDVLEEPEGRMVMRNGVWVDTGGKKETK